MSDNEMIIQPLKRIEKMLLQQTLLNKEVLNSKETAIYMGLSQSYICKLAARNKFPSFKPNKGRLYFKRVDLFNWILSKPRENISKQLMEKEKLTILNPERG